MLSLKLDWLTLSLKPDGTDNRLLDFDFAWKCISTSLVLGRFMERAVLLGRRMNYEKVYAYEGVQVQLPSAEDWVQQGICISISAEGLDYFSGYLKEMGFNLKEWLSAFRHLAFCGFLARVTRLDYAFDDIVCGDEDSKISIKRVLNAIRDGELCMKNRVWSDCGDDFNRLAHSRRRCQSVDGVDIEGVTIGLGKRKGEGTYIRFYDKLTELRQEKKTDKIPEGCKAWTRFEMEIKGSSAMSVLNHYLDLNDEDFAAWIRGVALDNVRFVERTSTNVTRCVVKRWWRDFLNGCTKAIKLPVLKPARCAVVRWSKWFKKEVFPSLNTARKYLNDDEKFLSWLDDIEQELIVEDKSTERKELLDNFNDSRRFYEYLSAVQEWEYCSELPSEEFHDTVFSYKNDLYWYWQHFNKFIRGDLQLGL